jgi:hypothetical protein
MNAPWPKLSTSIMPNTRVRPEAMVKIIIPIARPAAVSVTKVENVPMNGAATSATTSGVNAGRISGLRRGSAWPTSSAVIDANQG